MLALEEWARRAPGGPPNGRARREAGPAAARSADALMFYTAYSGNGRAFDVVATAVMTSSARQ
jgi:hypothetical protein